MTVVGLGLSIAGLALTLIVYVTLEKLRTVPGKILMNLTLSLLLAQFFFAFGTGKMAWPNFCTANAVLEHYLWLVSFFWMNVISLDLAKTFMSSSLLSHDDRGRSLLAVYSVYSWGLPFLKVTACFLLDILDVVPDNQLKYASIRACFLSGYNGMLYAFVLPLTVIMVVNIICFIGVLLMLTKASSLEKKIQKNRIKRNQHFLLAKLLPITGLTWTFGVVATFSKITFLWNPFIILNSLQGVFVFCAFVLNSRVKRMLKAKLSQISQEATGTSNTRF
ncbi:adhesion G-protein coupled receptor D1-like [Liolophura sinensis]|uniref:adhesion G-protein coupled receptor D1-like n=1 Tax=Liolophura sinensis TaxID=3198878 RepID=UPI0031592BA8